VLRACRDQGLRVVLASSAGPGELEVLRAALGADDAVDEATSAGDVDQSKPAPDLVQVALDKAGVTAGEAVFVGDAVWDVQACQRAGVACVGVLSGGISPAELLDAGAVRVYQDAADILASFPASLLDGPAAS
jgi:phosphoglycolate phosphatase-like HAD superfamily hydrolase